MSAVNRYSYVLLSLLLVGAGAAYTALSGDMAVGGIVTLLLVAAVLIGFVLARRGALTPANPDKRIRRARGGGRPVVVHLYSDAHIGCLLGRPLSAAAERDYRGRCDFIYVDVAHREGPEVMATLEASVGDYVLFDAAGRPAGKVRRLTAAVMEGLLERAIEG